MPHSSIELTEIKLKPLKHDLTQWQIITPHSFYTAHDVIKYLSVRIHRIKEMKKHFILYYAVVLQCAGFYSIKVSRVCGAIKGIKTRLFVWYPARILSSAVGRKKD